MATAERDYYELLGVARGATDAEIKKAFRKLARELHPDVSKEADAQERFRAVAEAYEVLSKAETRQLYDRYGHAGLRKRRLHAGGLRPLEPDRHLLGLLRRRPVRPQPRRPRPRRRSRPHRLDRARRSVHGRQAHGRDGGGGRPASAATARAPSRGRSASRCQTCGGHGQLRQVSRSVFGEFVRTQSCPACAGAGSVVETPCTGCDGVGRTLEQTELEVEIPAGIHDGQRIRISGAGHAGASGGLPGDAYVEVHVARDARFERDGDDILAAGRPDDRPGGEGRVGHGPDARRRARSSTSRPARSPARCACCGARGCRASQRSGRGDHRVLVNVVVPRHLTDEQRELLDRFEALSGEDTYRRDEGFFEKLRSALR